VFVDESNHRHPVKPLSDAAAAAAASHSSERMASRDTSQSKKGPRPHQTADAAGHSSSTTSSVVDHRCRRLNHVTLELPLLCAAAVVLTLW